MRHRGLAAGRRRCAERRQRSLRLRLGVGLGDRLGDRSVREAGVVGAGVARRRRRFRRRLRLSRLGRSRGLARLEQGHEPLGRVAAPARVPRLGARRGARAVPEDHRAAGSGRDYHPGRAVAGEDDARRRARRRRRFFCRCPALLQGLEPLRTKRDRRRLPLVLGAGPGDVHAARAQRGERVGDGIGRARVGRRARRVGFVGAVFSQTIRAYRNRRAGTDAREERLPARVRGPDVAEVHEDGARPPLIAVVVVVHVDQGGAELLGVFFIVFIGILFRLRREQESLRVHARGVVVVVVARGVRFVAARSQTRRPREHHAVAVVVRGHAREDRGPARQISRRGDLQTGRIRGAVVRVRGGHAVPRRGLVELPQSPGRGDERRTLLGRGEPVHDSPRAARVRRARHEPRRGPGGQARRVITRGSYGNVSRKHVGWRGGVSARGRPSRVIALPRPRGRGIGQVVHQAKRVGFLPEKHHSATRARPVTRAPCKTRPSDRQFFFLPLFLIE